jgi:FkbM family methyltransferase
MRKQELLHNRSQINLKTKLFLLFSNKLLKPAPKKSRFFFSFFVKKDYIFKKMISLTGISEDGRKIFYKNLTNDVIDVIVYFEEGYTGAFIYKANLQLEPGVEYYSWHPAPFSERRVTMKEVKSGEVLAFYKIPGTFNLRSVDREFYLQNLIPDLEIDQQEGVMDVVREHLISREYADFCDIEAGDIVVDIGFNYGIFSLGALNKGASKIYAFEPNQNIINVINEIYPDREKITLEPVAVSNKNTTLTFYEGSSTLGSNIVKPISGCKLSYEVKCINFYEYLVDNNIEKIDLLKVDCEGTEYEIFECIPDEFFCQIRKIHVEFHDNDGMRIQSIINKLERTGFEWKFENSKDHNSDLGLIFARNKN